MKRGCLLLLISLTVILLVGCMPPKYNDLKGKVKGCAQDNEDICKGKSDGTEVPSCDCNTCICEDEQASCTLMGCEVDCAQENPEMCAGKADGTEVPSCDCNECECLGGLAICTEMACGRNMPEK